jgi:hypothetical protein
MTAFRKFILFLAFTLAFFALGWSIQDTLVWAVTPDLADLGGVAVKDVNEPLLQRLWTSLSFALWGLALAWGIALCFGGKNQNRALALRLTVGLLVLSTAIGALCLFLKRWNTHDIAGVSFVPDFQLTLAQLSIYQVGMAAAACALVFGIVLSFSRKPRPQTQGAAPSF